MTDFVLDASVTMVWCFPHAETAVTQAGVIPSVLLPVVALGREHGLSASDAAYLELAIRQSLPLATQDARLRASATRAGVALL